MIKIWHVATYKTNIGDGALVTGIQKTLREDWPTQIDFIPDCLMEYENYWGTKKYDSELVERINSQSDLLLIGGGGMLDGGRGDKNSGMGFNLPLDLFDKIKVPIVIYAVGHNIFDAQIYWNKKKLAQLIQYIDKRKNAIFSVRNDGSLARLRAFLKADLPKIREVPDPGLYVPTVDCKNTVLMPGKINILIQLAGDNEYSRFSAGIWRYVPFLGRLILRKRRIEHLRDIGRALQESSKCSEINFILCPHLVRDLSVNSEFIASVPTSFSRFNFNVSEIVRGSEKAKVFFNLYKSVDLVIGMRGHSIICGVGLGTPTIALSSHKKVRGFMESVGLVDRIIDLDEPTFIAKLIHMIDEIISNRESEIERLTAITNRCREETRIFHNDIYALLNS